VCRFRFVAEQRHVYGVKRLCRVVGVSRSGFYAWLGRPRSARSVSDAELAGIIVEIHDRSRRTYGAPRVHAELARLGRRCGRKRVARLMRSQQLVGVHARRRWRRGRPDTALAPDLVQRNFNPTGPDRVWAGDVTQFRTAEGWLHLAAVIDLWSRRVVGWAMDTTVNAELVTDALVMAFQRRRPDRRVVHHSYRGAAYTSLAFSQRVVELVLDQSFGSTGDCYDNAAVESVFATLKRELAWIHATKTWPTRAALRSALFDYIEGFYNPERIQHRLGHQSPINYEQDSAA
jgi:putative transposase